MSVAEAERLSDGAESKDEREDDIGKLQSEDAALIAWITSCEDTPFVPSSRGGGVLAPRERMPFRWGAGTLELVVQQIPLLAGKASRPVRGIQRSQRATPTQSCRAKSRCETLQHI